MFNWELLGEIQFRRLQSASKIHSHHLWVKKHMIVSFDFSLGSVTAGQSRLSIFLSAGRHPCPWISEHTGACLILCVMVEQGLGFVPTVCGNGHLCALTGPHGTAVGSSKEKAQHKACSGTACLGDTTAGSCDDWGVSRQVFVVIVILSEEFFTYHCASSYGV